LAIAANATSASFSTNECATGPPIAVGERVDGFELRMGDGGLRAERQVFAASELDRIVHQGGYAVVTWRHEVRAVSTE
jgi:hypothetical protein